MDGYLNVQIEVIEYSAVIKIQKIWISAEIQKLKKEWEKNAGKVKEFSAIKVK